MPLPRIRPVGPHARGSFTWATPRPGTCRQAGPAPAGGEDDLRPLTRGDYENLLAFRVGLRRFQHWSQSQARGVGLTPAQHQLLLAIKGHPGRHSPAVGDLAGDLLLRPHSTVELVDRAEAAGLVQRCGDDTDGRITRVRLTADGEHRLSQLAAAHLAELQHLVPLLDHLVAQPATPGTPPPGPPDG